MIPTSLVDAVQLALRARGVVRHPADLREIARVAVEAALESGEVVLARCSCPVGWGEVRDANCPTHGVRSPAHTVAMSDAAGRALGAERTVAETRIGYPRSDELEEG